MRDIELTRNRLISLITSMEKLAKAGKVNTADAEHSVICRSKAFEEYVEHCELNSIDVRLDQEMISCWAKADRIDINSIPECERDGAVAAITKTASILNRLGLGGAYIGSVPMDVSVAAGDDEDIVGGFSAYGNHLSGVASGLVGSEIISAYKETPKLKPGAGSGGDQLFSLVQGVVSCKAGKDGEQIYSIDGKEAFREYASAVVPSKNMQSDENTLLAAALLASKKFGGSITIKGDDKFVANAMHVIAKHGIDVKFTDPAQANFFLGVASSIVKKGGEESVLDSAAKKPSFADRMADVAAYGASMATGGVVSAEKIRAVAETIEGAASSAVAAAKKTPTVH